MFIVSQIKGSETGDLIPYKIVRHSVSKESKLAAYKDLQKLTRSGYIDDKIAYSDNLWFVTPDNFKIMLPSFETLRNLKTGENKIAMQRYYIIIFGNK